MSRPKLVVAAIASLYFLWCAYDPSQWHLIDGVNLVIHEAGHLFFTPLGEFMMIAGGSLFQVIVPAVFVGYFWYHSKYYSAALVLFWVGQSILNVSVYAGDSLALQLPLLGGEDSIHDWNYLLSLSESPSGNRKDRRSNSTPGNSCHRPRCIRVNQIRDTSTRELTWS